jgi:hypothetical protein
MAVTFTSARAILIIQATSLAAEATSAGLTSLATALTNLASEITANSDITEQEFFGGGTATSGPSAIYESAALVWSNILDTAASIISAHNSNVITTALETIATQTTTMAIQTTTLATKLTDIEAHQQRIRELGEGDGIHMIGPYEQFGFVSIYRSLIEEGKILAWRGAEPSEKDVAKALNDLGKYIEKIRANIPRSF